MEFSAIRDNLKTIEIEALRTDCDNYFEAVIVKKEIVKLNNRLKKFFGEPAWPSKNRLNYQAQEAINGYGGIMPGQTLYLKSEGSENIFAMLWPWQDGERTTIKIFQK